MSWDVPGHCVCVMSCVRTIRIPHASYVEKIVSCALLIESLTREIVFHTQVIFDLYEYLSDRII